MKKNRLLAITLSAALLLGFLAGCGNKNSNDKPGNPDNVGNKPANSSVELNVVTSYGGDDGNRKNYENAVKSYEEATGNKVLDASASSI